MEEKESIEIVENFLKECDKDLNCEISIKADGLTRAAIENLIKKCKECKLNECINCEISWTEIQEIKKLVARVKELEQIEAEHQKENGELREQLNELEKYKTLYINIQGMRNGKELLKKYINDSVLKSTIREKIEEYKKKENCENGKYCNNCCEHYARCKTLQELLEDK